MTEKQVDVELVKILEKFEKDLIECEQICKDKSFDYQNEKGDIYIDIIVELKSLFKKKARECVPNKVIYSGDDPLTSESARGFSDCVGVTLKNIDQKFK